MDLRHSIVCRRCFREFRPEEVKFKCVHHDTRYVFTPGFAPGKRGRPRYDVGLCPSDKCVCPFRVCPHCEADLPHYAGRVPGHVVAVAGARTSGKTTYVTALLTYLIEKSAAGPPWPVPMFEDERSHRWFSDLYQQMAVRKELPDPTLAAGDKVDPDPVNVRLYGRGLFGKKKYDGSAVNFIVLYDPAGELFESFRNASFVRYLGRAAGIILTVDPEQLARSAAGRLRIAGPMADATDPSNVINAVAQNIRGELGLSVDQRIDIPLAVLLTKADAFAPPKMSSLLRLNPLGERGSVREKWKEYLDQVHECCRDLLIRWGQEGFLTLVDQQFSVVAYFCSSAVDMSAEDGGFEFRPAGVADPLLWML